MRVRTCSELRRYLEREDLHSPVSEAMTVHLAQCESCRTEWRELLEVERMLAKRARPPRIPPPNVALGRVRILRRIEADRAPIWRKAARRFPRAPFGNPFSPSVVVGLGLALVLGMLVGRSEFARLHGGRAPAPRPAQIAKLVPGPAVRLGPSGAPPLDRALPGRPVRPPYDRARAGQSVRPPVAPGSTSPAPRRPSESPVGFPAPALRSSRRPSGVGRRRVPPLPFGGRRPEASPHPSLSPPARWAPEGPAGASPRPGSLDDLAAVNALPDRTGRPQLAAEAVRIRGEDDAFIAIPAPQFAARNSPAVNAMLTDAVKRYQQERNWTDPRLRRKVDVDIKGGDLADLASALSMKTGVSFSVRRDCGDRKLTVMMAGERVRDLMREAARMFDLQWYRTGAIPDARYELGRRLSQRFAEEELKNRDRDEMLLDAEGRIEPLFADAARPRPDLLRLAAEARASSDSAGTAEEKLRWMDRSISYTELAMNHEFADGVELFSGLTPGDLVALRDGKEVALSSGDPRHPMPPEIAARRRQAAAEVLKRLGHWPEGAAPNQLTIRARFTADRSGPVATFLNCSIEAGIDEATPAQFAWHSLLAVGTPAYLRRPEDPKSRAVQADPPKLSIASSTDAGLRAPISLGPLVAHATPAGPAGSGVRGGTPAAVSNAWVDSADLFEALHRITGRNILADYYTRTYPADRFSFRNRPLRDVLADGAYQLESECAAAGDMLEFRRIDYYNENDLDVPNRLLKRWSRSREIHGGLTLDDLSEIASLPDDLLKSDELGGAVERKYGLVEWPLAATARKGLLFYAELTPEQRIRARSGAGISLTELSPAQLAAALTILEIKEPVSPSQLAESRFGILLTPRGRYHWEDWAAAKHSPFPLQPDLSSTTRAAANDAVAKRLSGRGIPPPLIAEEQDRIAGPKSAVWFRATVGSYYLFQEADEAGGQHSLSGPLD